MRTMPRPDQKLSAKIPDGDVRLPSWVHQVTGRTIISDLVAGLTGALIVLPQGVAYALIAGLPPEYGLYTAIITPIVAALLGSSHHLISGPTAAISIITFSVVSQVTSPSSTDFIKYAITLTFLVGVVQIFLGLLRFGKILNFISKTVIVGFTTGAAIVIAATQLPNLLGLPASEGHSFVATIKHLSTSISEVNAYSLVIGVTTIVAAAITKRLSPKIPPLLVAMLAGSVVSYGLNGSEQGVRLIGGMPGQLPPFSFPGLTFDAISNLWTGAIAVALIGLIESVSIARAVGIRSGQRIRANKEILGQGMSNIVGSFFSCYAGAGSFTRSGANYDSGAKTPMAAIFASSFVAALLLIVPWITAYLPIPTMSAVVLLIAWNLVDHKSIGELIRSSWAESLILFVTVIASVFLGLDLAVYCGALTSLVVYLHKTAHPRVVPVAPVQGRKEKPLRNAQKWILSECPQLKMYRIDGSLFFGSTEHIKLVIEAGIDGNTSHVLIVCSGVNFIDISGKELIANIGSMLEGRGGYLALCNLKDPARESLRAEPNFVGLDNVRVYSSPEEAISRMTDNVWDSICRTCTARIFDECSRKPGHGSTT
ncbi:SulP family inorganic anion transporter [Ectothiorhodospiraceae bacterium WFHF3C12]|nr:SulP family inorganic anion transporter [Ectothiorhodospiraceae bacterium WFHF3C12]